MIHDDSVLSNINFDAGNLSSDGGAVLMHSFFDRSGYLDLLNSLTFIEDRVAPKYSNFDIVKQMLNSIVLGYFHLSDSTYLRNDPLINDDSSIASQPTLSKALKRVTRLTNNGLSEIIKQTAARYVSENLDDIILDIDSTLVETYGRQEAAAYIHHYSTTGYHPIIVNEGHTGLALFAALRTGSCHSANGAQETLEEVLGNLDAAGKTVHMRGDSAFYNSRLMNYLDDENVEFFIRAKNTSKLIEAVYSAFRNTDMDIEDYSADNPYYGEISYTVNETVNSTPYRMAFKCFPAPEKGKEDQMSIEPNLAIYCVITNNSGKTPREIMDYYEARGAIENCNKELKNGFGAGTLSHASFIQNEFAFLLKTYAYNLYQIFRLTVLEGKDQKMTMPTYRSKFQKIAVKIINHSRRKRLSYSSAYPGAKKFKEYLCKTLKIKPHLQSFLICG